MAVAMAAPDLSGYPHAYAVSDATALGEKGGSARPRIRTSHFAEDACALISEEARKHRLPDSFFARLLWKESLFNPDALSHRGAQGIAQFMPTTASERGLVDPFEPAEAIAASANYLADLQRQFGNWGLAAAAYNGGPMRVENWLAGVGNLPLETQEYVHFVTGHRAGEWAKNNGGLTVIAVSDNLPFATACPKLAARTIRARMPATNFVAEDERTDRAEAEGSKLGGTGNRSATPKAEATRMPWGVQIAAHFSKEVALQQFARAKKSYGSVLKRYSASVVRTKNRTRGLRPLHSARVAVATREAAEALCGKLRTAGGACLVVKN